MNQSVELNSKLCNSHCKPSRDPASQFTPSASATLQLFPNKPSVSAHKGRQYHRTLHTSPKDHLSKNFKEKFSPPLLPPPVKVRRTPPVTLKQPPAKSNNSANQSQQTIGDNPGPSQDGIYVRINIYPCTIRLFRYYC